MHALTLVARQAQGVRGHRRHGPGQADERHGLAERHRARRVVQRRPHVGARGRDLVGRGGVGVEVPLGHPHRADVEGQPCPRRGVAEDELGRPAAQVDDQVRAGVARRHARRRAPEGQLGLLLAGHDLRVDTDGGADAGRERVPVARVAGGRRRDEAHARGPRLGDDGGVLAGGGERALQRLRGELAGAVDPLPQPDDLQAAVHLRQGAVVVDVGDEEADGVGAAVDGGDARGGARDHGPHLLTPHRPTAVSSCSGRVATGHGPGRAPRRRGGSPHGRRPGRAPRARGGT